MTTLTARSRWIVPEQVEPDTDAFVSAVIRSHEAVLRSLRRLAAGVAWPVEGDPVRSRRVAVSRGDSRVALEVVRW
jgi:hypothetical protein